MELNDFKNYLHVDADLTDDDSLIQSLMTSAKEYIVNSTGKKWTESFLGTADATYSACT